MRWLILLVLPVCAAGAGKLAVPQLLQMSHHRNAAFEAALEASLGEAEIRKGTAVLGEGPDFIWAVESEKAPELFVDGRPEGRLKRVNGSNLWFTAAQLKVGASHWFYYSIDGNRFGGSYDVPAFGPDSYEHPGVPRGKLSEKLVLTSRLYPGMKSDYWIYAPAQYDPSVPAAVMIWQDGHNLADREKWRAQIVFDNLTAQKKIPVIVHVFLDPGKVGDRPMRSIEYDTVTDKYARFLLEEVLPEVGRKYKLRTDGYSRAIAGLSSGGICSFDAAWFKPDQFSRVLSWIGSFTSIQWRPGQLDGGNVFPFMIRKQARRNIRVWLQDGSEDLENNHGSWPLQNIEMANSLKMAGYDFHFSFGHGTHNPAQGIAELPEEMTWLWRDYDAAKSRQTFKMDPAESGRPYFRVNVYTRE